MLDQCLPSGSGVSYSLNGEGMLRKALDRPIESRARKPGHTRDEGNPSMPQSLAIEGSDQVLLSLIEMRKEYGVLPPKFFDFAHPGIIASLSSFVTINFLLRPNLRGLGYQQPRIRRATRSHPPEASVEQ